MSPGSGTVRVKLRVLVNDAVKLCDAGLNVAYGTNQGISKLAEQGISVRVNDIQGKVSYKSV
jgi:hypothetical protein